MSTYHIDPEGGNDDGVLLVKVGGAAQGETIVRLLQNLNTLAEGKPSLRLLMDETELRGGFVGLADMGRIVQAWRKAAALRTARIAVVASNPIIYGLNRMFQGLADGADRVSVFDEPARARAWLLEG